MEVPTKQNNLTDRDRRRHVLFSDCIVRRTEDTGRL